MAEQIINTKLQIRNDTKANWNSQNPILLKGEMGIEIDSGKFKFGNGIDTWSLREYASAQSAILNSRVPNTTDSSYDVGVVWINTSTNKAYILFDNTANNALWKQITFPEDLADLGGGDMLANQYATNAKSSSGYVDKAIVADKLTTPRTISASGDVTAIGVEFDATQNITLNMALANVITAGSGSKITINSKGLVTALETLSSSDIPNLTMSKITDAGTAATKNIGIASGNVVVVGVDGRIDSAVIPAISITDVYEVSTEAAMLALVAQQGDVAIRSDLNKTFILKQSPATMLSNWVELKTPTDTVLSVNGETGAITLTTSNIQEGANLYYSEARATANFNANFVTKTSFDLVDGSSILHNSDMLILNGGTSNGW